MVRFKAMAAGLLVVGLGLVGCQSGGAGAQDRASADDLLVQGDRAFEAGAMGEALELYKLASVAARNERDSARFAEAAAQVSSSLSLLGRTTDGSPWLAQARQEKYGDDARSQARVLLATGLEQRELGQNGAATVVFGQLYELGMGKRLFGDAMQAATLASVTCAPAEQVTWCERALAAAEADGNKAWIAAAHLSLGFAWEARGDHGAAVEELRTARNLEAPGTRERLRIEWALAHNLRLKGDLAEAGKLLKEAIPVARSFHARGFAVRDAEWLGRLQEEYAEWLVQCGNLTDSLRAFQAARQAYQLAEIQDRAPEKWRGFEARVAQVRMLRVRGNQNAEDGHEQGHSHGE